MHDEATSLDVLERALAFRAGALMTSYPDDEVRAKLKSALPELLEAPLPPPPASALRLTEDDEFMDAARSEYIDVFDRSRQRNPLYETEYGVGLAKGNELSDVAAFYRAFGLEFGQATPEAPDHLAVELEFYGVLLLKEAVLREAEDAEGLHVVVDARRKFLLDHLGRLALGVATRPAVKASVPWGDVFAWCAALVGAECKRLGIDPTPVRLISDVAETEGVECEVATPKSHLPVLS